MSTTFLILTTLFIVVSASMILIILVQRAQGGGLAGAFGGAGGGTDTVFGGRVGDALTWATVVAFCLYLLFAVALNRVEVAPAPRTGGPEAAAVEPTTPTGTETPAGAPATEGVPEGVFQPEGTPPADEGSGG